MTEIFLLRHGETEWNAEGRFQGQRDSSLTARGREQAGQLGRILSQAFAGARVPPFYVSPLGRTRDTATIVGRHLDASGTMCVEPRLQEVSTGVWDGLTREAIEAGWPGALDGTDHFDWYFRSPDGETLETALEGVQSWLSELENLWWPFLMACSGVSYEAPGSGCRPRKCSACLFPRTWFGIYRRQACAR